MKFVVLAPMIEASCIARKRMLASVKGYWLDLYEFLPAFGMELYVLGWVWFSVIG